MYLNLPIRKVLLCTFLFLSSLSINARTEGDDLYLGTFHSPKGFGAAIENDVRDGVFDSYIAYADFYALLSGKSSTPGFKFSYLHNMVFKEGTMGKLNLGYSLFAGPGFTAGVLRDDSLRFGLSGGISGDLGIRVKFPSSFSISLSFQADISALIKFHEGNTLGLYKYGLYRAYLPQLIIGYSF